MFYLILAVVSFFALMLLFGWMTSWDDSKLGEFFLASCMFTFLIVFFTFIVRNEMNVDNCLEKNVTIVPKIIYTSDSSRKILQYNYENRVREIELKKDNLDYFIPESLLLIEPCEHKIRIKKEN